MPIVFYQMEKRKIYTTENHSYIEDQLELVYRETNENIQKTE